MGLAEILGRFQPELEAELKSVLDPATLPLYDMLRYHLGWIDQFGHPQEAKGGKALRPSLCLLACQAVGGDWKKVLPAAAALELVHNFSLIHDDIEDGDLERRGRATVWSIWGQPQAINAGDAMYALARMAILRLDGVGPQKVVQAARLLDETCLRLCEGQHLDISYETRLDIDIDDYLEMIGGKTGALFRCSLTLGALLGSDDEQATSHLGHFGFNLGLAFQVRDDVLGIWGDEDITGKPIGSDIRRRKKTLPVVYGLGKAEKLRAIYQREVFGGGEVKQALDILGGLGAEAYAQGVADGYLRQALSELEASGVAGPARADLEEIASFLVRRDY